MSGQDSPAESELIEAIDQEAGSKIDVNKVIQTRQFFQVITNVAKECFNRCVPRIHDKLEPHEQTCLANCAARLVESESFVLFRFLEKSEYGNSFISGQDE